MRFLPVFLDLTAGTVMLVGSGEAALNKLRLLASAGARVRWFVASADIAQATAIAADLQDVDIVTSDPLAADLSDTVAVVAAAGRPLDDAIAARAKAARIPVNVVDRPDLSSFIFPAIVDRGDVVVAIGTGGAAPVLARRLRERSRRSFPQRIGRLAALMGRYRAQPASRPRSPRARRRFWERVVDGPIGARVLAGRTARPRPRSSPRSSRARRERPASAGTVHLVGAGPGDPDLLTLRAAAGAAGRRHRVLRRAGDRREMLDRARRDAERVFVGKRRGEPGIGQDEINRRLVEAAQRRPARGAAQGRRSVRVRPRRRGARASARAPAFRSSWCPGITAALGCAAEAGLPLTFRNEATRLTLRHRASRRRGGVRRLVGPRRSADHRRRLYGPRLGRRGARRPDRRRARSGDARRRARARHAPRRAGRRRPARRSAGARRAGRRRPGAARHRRRRRPLEPVARRRSGRWHDKVQAA